MPGIPQQALINYLQAQYNLAQNANVPITASDGRATASQRLQEFRENKDLIYQTSISILKNIILGNITTQAQINQAFTAASI